MSEFGKCPFCSRIEEGSGDLFYGTAASFEDSFPVSPGHTLVVPRRHEEDFFNLTDVEQRDLWALVALVRERLKERLKPNGFNVGFNNGAAAGQTVQHTHVHIIPRFDGDTADPRGGIRWVLPQKAKYWND